jgi:cytochrome c biogenesis protein CcdA
VALFTVLFAPLLHAQRLHHPVKVWLWLPVFTIGYAVLFALIATVLREYRRNRYNRIMKEL